MTVPFFLPFHFSPTPLEVWCSLISKAYNYVTGNALLAQIACSSILVVIATVQHSSQNSGSLGHWFSSPQVFGSLGPQFLVHWVKDLYLTFLSGMAVQIHQKNHIIHSKST